MSKQPEALRLAHLLDEWRGITARHAAAELRRLYAENEALRGPIRTSDAIDWRLTAAEIEAQYRAMARLNAELVKALRPFAEADLPAPPFVTLLALMCCLPAQHLPERRTYEPR